MTKNKIKRYLCFIVLLVTTLMIGVGYSAVTNKLTISNTSKIANSIWDIHFENIKIASGSVKSAHPIITNGTNLSYDVNLEKPGDFYEFSVDVKNSGNIDAVMEEISYTELTDKQNKYLDYSVIYNSKELKAGSNQTIKVRIKYKTDVNKNDLPTNNETLNLAINMNYIQK